MADPRGLRGSMREVCQEHFSGGSKRVPDWYEKGGIAETACWAHVRRKFHDLYQAHRSPIAKEALEPHQQLRI